MAEIKCGESVCPCTRSTSRPLFQWLRRFPLPIDLLDLFLVDKLHVSRIPFIRVIWPPDSFIKVVHLASGWTFSFN